MLKIPKDGKLIDTGRLYRYADGEFQRLKATDGESSEIARQAEIVRNIIGDMAYELPEIKAPSVKTNLPGTVVLCSTCRYLRQCRAVYKCTHPQGLKEPNPAINTFCSYGVEKYDV